MSNTQGAELTVRELLQKNNVRNGDTQRADGRIYQAVVDSQKNAKIVEWVEIRSERTDEQEFKHTCLSAASIVLDKFESSISELNKFFDACKIRYAHYRDDC